MADKHLWHKEQVDFRDQVETPQGVTDSSLPESETNGHCPAFSELGEEVGEGEMEADSVDEGVGEAVGVAEPEDEGVGEELAVGEGASTGLRWPKG